MQNLEVYLKEILCRFDRVVVPNLGEFVSYYKPAFRDKTKNVFYPPSKHLSFTINGRSSDGLIVDEIAKRCFGNREQIEEFVDRETKQWKESIEKNNKIELEKIGTLLLSKTGKITFQSDQTENFLLDAFGLFPVYSPQVQTKEAPEVIELNTYDEAEVIEEFPLSNSVALTPVSQRKNGDALPVKWHSTFKKYKVSVAAAAGLLLVPTAYFFGNSELSKESQFSYLNPFKLFSEAEYQPRSVEANQEYVEAPEFNDKIVVEKESTISKSSTVAELKALDVKLVAKTTAKENVGSSAKEEIYANIDKSLRYHLINGCYKEEKNAAKWVKNLRKKGHGAHILDKYKGLYRVSMGSFGSRKLAHKEYTQLKHDGVKSWILKK